MGGKSKSQEKQNHLETELIQYHQDLRAVQIELVKFQKHLIRGNEKVLVIFEGRDAAGKDGTIKHFTEHLSPRETRIVALGKPSDREQSEWYFQRYVSYLPSAQEIVFFNRSWYNRAGVERVMGFCSESQYEEFMETVPYFEQMIVRSGTKLFKYYLDIDREEQKRRLESRKDDPLKQWKISPIDLQAQKHWADYSNARNQMFARTHSAISPWIVVRANDKDHARIQIIRDFLSRVSYKGKNESVVLPDPTTVFLYDRSYLDNGMIAP